MLSLRNHHWLYELHLLLPRLSIHSHLLRINRLHLKRLAVLVEVTRNLDSILRSLSLAIRGLIDDFYGLLRHTWGLVSLSHYLWWMMDDLLNLLVWLGDHVCCWLNYFSLGLNTLLFNRCCSDRSGNILYRVLFLRDITLWCNFLLKLKLLLLLLLFLFPIGSSIYRIRLLKHNFNWLIWLLLNPPLLMGNHLLHHILLLSTSMRNSLRLHAVWNILWLILTVQNDYLVGLLIDILELLRYVLTYLVKVRWHTNNLTTVILLLMLFLSCLFRILCTCLQEALWYLLIDSISDVTFAVSVINITVKPILKQKLLPWDQSTSHGLLLSLNI